MSFLLNKPAEQAGDENVADKAADYHFAHAWNQPFWANRNNFRNDLLARQDIDLLVVAARCLTAAEFPEPRAVAVEALLSRTLAIYKICNVSDRASQRLVINTDRELGVTVPQLSTATLKMYSQHYKGGSQHGW